MTFDIAMGVRRTDKELKAQVDSVLSSVAPQIRTILASYGAPLHGRRRPIDKVHRDGHVETRLSVLRRGLPARRLLMPAHNVGESRAPPHLLKANRCLDIITQDPLPVSTSPARMVSMPLRNSSPANAGSRATRFCTSSLKSRVTAMARLLIIAPAAFAAACSPPTTLSPFRYRGVGAAWCISKQDHQRLAASPETHPVARPQSIRYSSTPPYAFRFEVFPALPCPAIPACVLSCTIIGCGANKWTQTYHDRMPVILHEKDFDAWLDGS